MRGERIAAWWFLRCANVGAVGKQALAVERMTNYLSSKGFCDGLWRFMVMVREMDSL